MFHVVVVGGCAVDEGYRATSPNITHNKMLATSTPSRFLFRSAGGVGRNLADVLRKLLPDDSYSVDLVSAVGKDSEGSFVLSRCKESQLGTRLIAQLAQQTKLVDATRHEELRSESEQEDLRPRPATTAKYVAILDGSGELAAAAAAMSIFESKEFYDHIKLTAKELVGASAVVVDTNLPAPHFLLALKLARQQEHKNHSSSSSSSAAHNSFKLIAIDPISIEKGRRVVPILMKQTLNSTKSDDLIARRRNVMTIIKPNHIEASAMAEESLSRAPAQLAVSLDELRKRLKVLLPRKPLPSSASALSPHFAAHSSVDNHHHHISDILSSSSSPNAESVATLLPFSSMADVSQQILYEASRNAVILMFMMELDLVIVSCGSNGSIACFASRNENECRTSSSCAAVAVDGDSDMSLLEFNQHWRPVPLESGKNYYLRWFPPRKVRKVEKVTGAGDTFFGSIISHLLLSMTIPPNSQFSEGETEVTSENMGNFSCPTSEYFVWTKLNKICKGQHISHAIENASTNASLALMTKKGATPKLVTLTRKGLPKGVNEKTNNSKL